MPSHVTGPRVALAASLACFGFASALVVWSLTGPVVGAVFAGAVILTVLVLAVYLLADPTVLRPDPREPVEGYVRLVGDGSRGGTQFIEVASGRPVPHVHEFVLLGLSVHPPRAALLIQPPGVDGAARRVVVAVTEIEMGADVPIDAFADWR